jgi:hypothetical protein
MLQHADIDERPKGLRRRTNAVGAVALAERDFLRDGALIAEGLHVARRSRSNLLA